MRLKPISYLHEIEPPYSSLLNTITSPQQTTPHTNGRRSLIGLPSTPNRFRLFSAVHAAESTRKHTAIDNAFRVLKPPRNARTYLSLSEPTGCTTKHPVRPDSSCLQHSRSVSEHACGYRVALPWVLDVLIPNTEIGFGVITRVRLTPFCSFLFGGNSVRRATRGGQHAQRRCGPAVAGAARTSAAAAFTFTVAVVVGGGDGGAPLTLRYECCCSMSGGGTTRRTHLRFIGRGDCLSE